MTEFYGQVFRRLVAFAPFEIPDPLERLPVTHIKRFSSQPAAVTAGGLALQSGCDRLFHGLAGVFKAVFIPDSGITAVVDGNVNLPQLLILEFAIDGLRLAAVNTPSMLTTPLSVIAGIVLGEYSVKSGWFNSETMLYMAFVTVANYSQASYELGYALKFMRVILLLLTSLFNFWGFAAGLLFSVCAIVFNRTIAGKSYIYPLIPFSWNECKKRFLRGRLPHTQK